MPKKVDQFENERKELLNKLFNLLGINENNNTVSLKELDNNIELQTGIIELVPEIKKYFVCSKWTCFRTSIEMIDRYYLSIIKNLIKNMNYNMFSKRTHLKDNDGNPYRDTIYHIIKK
jgi:hypothetical protein